MTTTLLAQRTLKSQEEVPTLGDANAKLCQKMLQVLSQAWLGASKGKRSTEQPSAACGSVAEAMHLSELPFQDRVKAVLAPVDLEPWAWQPLPQALARQMTRECLRWQFREFAQDADTRHPEHGFTADCWFKSCARKRWWQRNL